MPTRGVASVMAFGSGVLISAVAFDLVEEAVVFISNVPEDLPAPRA